MTGIDRPTTTAAFATGVIEYRYERCGSRTLLILHGGHIRAGVALGEREPAEAGFSLLWFSPDRPRITNRFCDFLAIGNGPLEPFSGHDDA
ncbi:hypothetical protein [Actinoplanes sp. NPDC051494]|uniref:hypothetical protein n=1 Tax=Actinoplanes sp. NPDC051494 TaxID=3363907 RepID=UPI003792CF3D